MPRRYSSAEVQELEESWDYLISFKEFVLPRLSEAGLRKFRDANEIDGDFYDWMENRFGAMIEGYMLMHNLSFVEAQDALMGRPYIDIAKRWKRYFRR
jgi:hypothetical protein